MTVPAIETIPSRQLEVWRRLYQRYSLEPFPASVSPDVLKTIVPVTQADLLLRVPVTVVSAATDLQAAAGTYVAMHTVPDGKRWNLVSISRSGTTGSSRVRFRAKVGDGLFSMTVGGTNAEILVFPGTMDQLADIGMDTTGNAGDTGVFLSLHYTEEDAF